MSVNIALQQILTSAYKILIIKYILDDIVLEVLQVYDNHSCLEKNCMVTETVSC